MTDTFQQPAADPWATGQTSAPSFPSTQPQAPSPESLAVPSGLLDFQPPKREVIKIPFRLAPDPHIYHFTAPKIAVALLPVIEGGDDDDDSGLGVTASTFDWLGQGLSEEDNKRIVARLQNPEDDLDIDTLGAVVRGLMERVGQRPTT